MGKILISSLIEKVIKKVTGKKEFILSKDVPLTYIIHFGSRFLIGLLRGKIKGIGITKGSKLFIGARVKIYCKNKLNFGDNVRIEDSVFINGLSKNGIVLGNRVKIGRGSEINCSGSLANLGKGISIGDNSSFAENTYFGAAGGISIGGDVISGQNVRFHSENHNYQNSNVLIRLQGVNQKGIVVGNNVWIGSGVVFLDGSRIGDGCVIAANTVVKGEYSDNSVIAGVPSKFIKYRIG